MLGLRVGFSKCEMKSWIKGWEGLEISLLRRKLGLPTLVNLTKKYGMWKMNRQLFFIVCMWQFYFTFQALIRTIQNKTFYKVRLGLDEPDLKAIEENSTAFRNAENIFLNYYLGKKDFLGGNEINVCDLIATATFEQVRCWFVYCLMNILLLKSFVQV